MPRRRPVGARYAYIVEMKDWRNQWVIQAPPFYGHTRIAARRLARVYGHTRRAARRLALDRFLIVSDWNHRLAFGIWHPNSLRVKGIRIHRLNC